MSELLEKSVLVEFGMSEEQVKGFLSEPHRFTYRRKKADTGEDASIVWLTWTNSNIAVDVCFKNGAVVEVVTRNFEPPFKVECYSTSTIDDRFIKVGHLHEVTFLGLGCDIVVFIESAEVIGGHVYLGVRSTEKEDNGTFTISDDLFYRSLANISSIRRLQNGQVKSKEKL